MKMPAYSPTDASELGPRRTLGELNHPSARAAFVVVEELFTRFEHLSALAQIALEDLQMALADIRELPGGDELGLGGGGNERPANILPFRDPDLGRPCNRTASSTQK